MRFLIVTHKWFVSSYGFNVKEVEAKNLSEAHKAGVLVKHDEEGDMRKCAFDVIALEDQEVLASRKLTIMERLKGRLNI